MNLKPMNFLKIIIIALLSGIIHFSAAENPPWSVIDTVEGTWRALNYETQQPELVVRVWSLYDTLYAEITDVISGELINNPVCQNCRDSLKNAPLKGLKIVWGLTRGDKNWTKGKMLDISDGKVYRCELQLNEKGELAVFSYVNRVFKVGRTYIWQSL
jgi:uncharacterized protein (DUF2147 family)